MNILVLNCGSSSIKYKLMKIASEQNVTEIAKGLVERIGLDEGIITHNSTEKTIKKLPIPDHATGILELFSLLTDSKAGAIKSLSEIDAVGHRVAHGGEFFKSSTLIDKNTIEKIAECSELAPLHNPANLKGILTVVEKMPNVKQVAVFDTAYHQTLPPKAYMYAIPYEIYLDLKLRKYGFHGTSHKYVAKKACNILGWNIEEKKIVSCHLGNGASLCAIDKGKSIDTSMGFTPNEGLMMGTRTGTMDLGALLYIAEKKGLNLAELNNFINKKSGLKGVSGLSSDMRDLENAAKNGNEKALLTLNMFSYRVKKFIGSYTAVLGGIDLLIFTGGIGENDPITRRKIASNLDYMGLNFDTERNNIRGKDAIISKEGSKVIAMTVTTNEELMIAKDTYCKINQRIKTTIQ